MNLRKVDAASNAAILKKVRQLYMTAFPKEERIPWPLVRLNALRRDIDLTAFLDGDTFCGFTYSVTVDDLHFLLFFAVDDSLRSKGYGSAILSCLKEEYGTVVLNIEPFVEDAPNLPERKHRYGFYRHNGFLDTGYHVWEVGGMFRVLSTSETLDVTAYQKLFLKLTMGVWKVKVLKADGPLYG